ncbi:Trifunctional enzyme subunit alpha, mitochondrial [Halotydeus destructor]|nr:Trifunctional enzyme subunit alpha, mitochondrial [Halotydeus destructor]
MSTMLKLVNHARRSGANLSSSVSLMRRFSGSTGQAIDFNIKDGVAVVKFNNKNDKMNVLGEQVSLEIKQVQNEIFSNPSISSVVVMSGKTENFIVGADIKMLEKVQSVEDGVKISKEGQQMLQRLADSSKPVVAAIMGPALGGGLEVAMACHYRIAVKDRKTVLGLPEVMLGLLPGAGGTQRLTSLVSIQEALPMMLQGKQVRADKAKKIGLVDLLVEPLGDGIAPGPERTLDYLEEIAISTAQQLAAGKLKINRTRPLVERVTSFALGFQFVRDKIFDKARAQVMKLTLGNYPSPLKILEVTKLGLEQGIVAGLDAEAKGFGQLVQTSQSKALIGLFNGQTQCKKNRFGKPKSEPKHVAVLGAGLMGAGIATVSINNAGHHVVLKDANINGLTRGEQQITKSLNDAFKRKKISSVERDRKLALLTPTLNYDEIRNADIVIEAVLEDINVKHRVVKEVEALVRDDCIFASNTSALPISKIAEASKRPENVIGMHYFSPVDKMQLLEIITTDKTSKEATAKAVQVGLKQGKVVITVKDGPAFYTTRILAFIMAEVTRILQEGVEFDKVDLLTKQLGFPVGAVTLMDEVGFDTAMHISKYLESEFGHRIAGGNTEAGREMVAAGFHGRKSGKGFFVYDGKKVKGKRPVNQKVIDMLARYKVKPPREFTDEELQMRMLTRMVNEAVLCYQEGILANPVEGDVGAVFGLGFPPFTGGPFRYLDTYGADRIAAWMDKFTNDYGREFEPCQLLRDHAKDTSKKFYPKH